LSPTRTASGEIECDSASNNMMKGFFCQSVLTPPTHWCVFVARARSQNLSIFILNNNLTLIRDQNALDESDNKKSSVKILKGPWIQGLIFFIIRVNLSL